MEQGFKLPISAVKGLAVQWALGLSSGVAVGYFTGASSSVASTLSVVGIAVLVLVGVVGYTSTYKYVYLSSKGLRGRGTSGIKWQHLSWQEPLQVKPSSLNGLKGYTFTSSVSSVSIFIPTAILNSVEFKAMLATSAPSGHVLRAQAF